MTRRRTSLPFARLLLAGCLLAWLEAPSGAQTPARPALGRISFFGNSWNTGSGASGSTASELIGTATFDSPSGDDVHYEYRADLRFAGYPGSTNRSRRVSIYDAYFGYRFRRGTMAVRGGQIWLNELGGLGAVGGGMFEIGQQRLQGRGRWRAVVFGGLEPNVFDAGYVSQVTKAGAFAAFDGAGLRRHVVGFVNVRDAGMTERSVLVVNNLLPFGKKLFVYQAGEYDVKSAGIPSPGALTYLFANARYTPTSVLEIQGSYHRGRSIDSRTIVRDQLDGRPIDPRVLDGLRFESASTRVTVTVTPGVRVFAGYGRDRNNHDEAASNRWTYGVFASNLFGTGFDVNASDSRMQRPGGNSFDSWYVSAGRSFSRRLYVTLDYGSSLSVLRFVTSSGFLIETRPHTRRMAASGLLHMTRATSLLTIAEWLGDGAFTQTRFQSGVTYRF
jgi:hypothetical protein